MEIILTKDVKGLGYINDLVVVKAGYGRNFLIPGGYAIIANESNKKRIAENVRQAAHKAAIIKKEAQAIADKISEKTIEIATKVGEEGKIFGSITPSQIVDKLKEIGVNIDRKKVILEDNLRQVGTYPVTLDLHREVKTQITISVTAE